MSQINTELGRSASANISLITAETGGYGAINPCSPSRPDGLVPYTINEWHGYNHTINCCGGSPCYTHTGWNFAGSCAAACAGPFTSSVYSCCATLGVNCSMAVNPTNCQPFYPATSGYLSNGTVCYTVIGNQLESVVNCAGTTTTTTSSGVVCHDFQATATSFMTWTDCCGNPQDQYLIAGDIFCAQIGTVYGYYIDLGTVCYC